MTAPVSIETEGRLVFEFDRATWAAVKWDNAGQCSRISRWTSSYRCEGCRHPRDSVQSTVYMFEVKDPRGNWTRYRNSTPVEALAALVADKVRDTIAGIVYARDRHPGDHLHVHLKSLMQERSSRPFVILWLEGLQADPALAITLTTLIERQLVC